MRTPPVAASLFCVVFFSMALPGGLSGCATGSGETEAEEATDSDSRRLRPGREDYGEAADALTEQLGSSELFDRWARMDDDGNRVGVATVPMEIDGPGLTPGATSILQQVETFLVNNAPADVVSIRDQPALRRERELTGSSDEFDSDAGASGDGDTGPRYLVTGRLEDRTEELDDPDRARYRITLQVVDSKSDQPVFEAEHRIDKP